MTENSTTNLQHFEEKLRLLLHSYNQIQTRNKILVQTIQEQAQELEELKQKYEILEQNHNNLKQAKVISLSDAEISATRERLNRLVREIDQCIESLTK